MIQITKKERRWRELTTEELTIHVKMPADKRQQIKEIANDQGMTVSSFVRSVLYKQIEEKKTATA